jgi:hypothetical protein
VDGDSQEADLDQIILGQEKDIHKAVTAAMELRILTPAVQEVVVDITVVVAVDQELHHKEVAAVEAVVDTHILHTLMALHLLYQPHIKQNPQQMHKEEHQVTAVTATEDKG